MSDIYLVRAQEYLQTFVTRTQVTHFGGPLAKLADQIEIVLRALEDRLADEDEEE